MDKIQKIKCPACKAKQDKIEIEKYTLLPKRVGAVDFDVIEIRWTCWNCGEYLRCNLMLNLSKDSLMTVKEFEK